MQTSGTKTMPISRQADRINARLLMAELEKLIGGVEEYAFTRRDKSTSNQHIIEKTEKTAGFSRSSVF